MNFHYSGTGFPLHKIKQHEFKKNPAVILRIFFQESGLKSPLKISTAVLYIYVGIYNISSPTYAEGMYNGGYFFVFFFSFTDSWFD